MKELAAAMGFAQFSTEGASSHQALGIIGRSMAASTLVAVLMPALKALQFYRD